MITAAVDGLLKIGVFVAVLTAFPFTLTERRSDVREEVAEGRKLIPNRMFPAPVIRQTAPNETSGFARLASE